MIVSYLVIFPGQNVDKHMHVALVFLFKELIGHVNYVLTLFKKINFSSTQCNHKFFFYIPVIFLVGATHGKGRCFDT